MSPTASITWMQTWSGAGVELRAHALGDRLLAADYDAAVGELAILEAVLAASRATAGFYASTRIV